MTRDAEIVRNQVEFDNLRNQLDEKSKQVRCFGNSEKPFVGFLPFIISEIGLISI